MNEDTTLDEFSRTEQESTQDKSAEEVSIGELQQLEKSPIESWELVKLGEILSLEYGDNLPSGSREAGNIPVYGSNGQVDTHSEAAVDKPGIVLGRKGSIGEIEFSTTAFWPIDTTYYITDEETSQNLRFLYYLLQNIQLERLNAASAIPGLNRNDTYGLNAIVPPLSEQRKIATVLSNVDQAIQKTEEIIDNLKHVLVGTRRNLMRKGVSNSELSESNSRFGKIPEEWNIRRLNSVSDVIGGSTPSTDEPEYWGGDIPWATPTDLTGLEDTVISGTNDYITEKGLHSTSTNLLPPQSVLMTSRATIGECAVNTVEMATNQGFQSLIPGESLDTWYLYYRMEEEASYLESVGSGSTFSEVSNTTVQKIQIPVPPISEQREIAEKLKSIEKLRLSEQDYYKRLKRLKHGLMQDLLSGTVRATDTNIEVPKEIAQYG